MALTMQSPDALMYSPTMAPRHVSDAGLRVSSELLGTELASPLRRLAAFAIDGAILVVPSLLIAILVAWATLAVRQPAALHALTGLIGGRLTTPEQQRAAMRDLIPLMVDYHMPGTPAEVAVAYHQGDLDRAVEALRDREIMIVLNVEGQPVGGSQKRMGATDHNLTTDTWVPLITTSQLRGSGVAIGDSGMVGFDCPVRAGERSHGAITTPFHPWSYLSRVLQDCAWRDGLRGSRSRSRIRRNRR